MDNILTISDAREAQANDGYYMPHMSCPAYGGILTLVIWILVIAGGILLVQYFARGYRDENRERRNKRTALEILEERYAKGEIDKREFDEKKKDLI